MTNLIGAQPETKAVTSTRPTSEISKKPIAMRAILWMLWATILYIPLPLFVWGGVGGGEMSPYLFTSIWYMTYALAWTLFRQVQLVREQQRRGACENTNKKIVRRPIHTRIGLLSDVARVKTKYLIWETIFTGNWAFLAVAVTLIEPVVATVIFEFWPVLLALLTLTPYWRNKMLDGKRSGDGPAKMLLMLVVGGVGVSLAVLSDTGTFILSDSMIVGGLFFALLSALGAGLSTFIVLIMGKEGLNSPPPGAIQNVIVAFANLSKPHF